MKILSFLKKIIKIIKLSFFLLILISTIIFIIKVNSTYFSNSDRTLNIISEENLVNEIKNTNKIIPLEIELSRIVTIDESWGNIEVFQKYKRIKFFANCSFYVDLSTLKEEDIYMDKDKKVLNINLPSPKIFTIDILRDKTIYEDSSNGLLRFGEIQLTSEEFEEIQEDVYKNFQETLNEKEIYEKAISSSSDSITSLLKKIVGNDIFIDINFH